MQRSKILDDDSSGDHLSTPATLPATPAATFDPASGQPRQLGPYRLLEVLGEGGMGRVFLAEQSEPVRRQVALKILRFAIVSDQLRARFDAERHAMGRLDHPNIGKLLEAGTTAEGQPFFAMELIDGEPITSYCDRHQLAIEDRLRIFVDVCRGTAHAHSRFVLHRDLKPSNVLVTEVDGRAFPKIIDFGVAKGLDESLVSATLATHDGLVGTPTYMSPEAIGLGGEVDTRSDVFSLGILLYKLLAGRLPWATPDPSPAAALKERIEHEARPPSTRVTSSDPAKRATVARRRGLGPDALAPRLRGDLDWIVMKAIAKDPDERYPSAAGLGDEVERYLRDEPVSARPPTAAYLARKLLRRHRAAFLGAAAALLAVVLGIVGTALGLVRANREAQIAQKALAEAENVSTFLVDLFEVADPERQSSEPADQRELLERGVERLRRELADQPLARARFLHTIGTVYTKMALFEPAGDLVAEALEIRQAELGEAHPDVLMSVNQLGVIRRRQDRLDEAEPLFRRVLAAREAAPTEDPVALARALNGLGNLLWSQEKLPEAETFYRRALAIREHELGAEAPGVAETLNNLGALLQAQHRYSEAALALRRAADIFAMTHGKDHPSYGAGLLNLAMVQEQIGQWPQAEVNLRQAIAIWQAAYGIEHPRSTRARNQLGNLLRRQGRIPESALLYRQSLQQMEAVLGAEDPALTGTLTGLAISLAHLGELDAAEARFQQALALYRTRRGEEHSSTINGKSNLAWLTWRRGRFSDAEAQHRQVLDLRQRLSPNRATTAWTLHYLALAVAAQGRDEEAEALLLQALEIREARLSPAHYQVGNTLHELGEIIRRQGRTDEATRFLRRALDVRLQVLPSDHPDLARTRAALAALGVETATSMYRPAEPPAKTAGSKAA